VQGQHGVAEEAGSEEEEREAAKEGKGAGCYYSCVGERVISMGMEYLIMRHVIWNGIMASWQNGIDDFDVQCVRARTSSFVQNTHDNAAPAGQGPLLFLST
jgi:hypothetical protein